MDQYRNVSPEPTWSKDYLSPVTANPTMQQKYHPPASSRWTPARWIAKAINYLQI